MAFGDFKSPGEVARTYRIRVLLESFIEPIPLAVSEAFRRELDFALHHIDVRASEAAVCEFLIAPVLKEVWRHYTDTLLLWSHVPFGATAPLMGTPDYLFSRCGPLGVIQEEPYLLLVEAKKDDFEAGWGQCLAAMLAAQKLNVSSNVVVYGCVSNGDLWQFGKLEGQTFTQEISGIALKDLSALFAALNYVFARASEQARAVAAKEGSP
jgi:hypothetical protein